MKLFKITEIDKVELKGITGGDDHGGITATVRCTMYYDAEGNKVIDSPRDTDGTVVTWDF